MTKKHEKKLRAKLVESIKAEFAHAEKQEMLVKAVEGIEFKFPKPVTGDPWLTQWKLTMDVNLAEGKIDLSVTASAGARLVEKSA